MARVPYLDKADLAPENRDLLSRNINLYRVLAHSPNGLRSFSALGKFIRHQSRLDPRLREMAILQVGYLALALRILSPHQDRPRFRRQRRRRQGDHRRDRGAADRARAARQSGAARGARDDD
jgi:alkylhydroperoxidase family enzyme